MGAFARGIQKRAASFNGGTLENPSNWMSRWLGGSMTAAGARVNERNALYAIDVYTCVSKIAQTIAQLPLPVYKKLPNGGKVRAREHPLYTVLQERANSEMTAFVFKELMQQHIDVWGNSFSFVERNPDGDCSGLWPLLPDRTFPFRVNGELYYQSRIKKTAGDPGDERTFPARDVLHVPGASFDGLVGYSPISMMAEQIGLALAQEEFGARFFSNGATPPSVLTYPGKLGEEDVKRIKASWGEQHQGASRAWKIAVLESGLELKTIGVPPQDAQLLEGQKFSRARIAGLYGVPPPLMGDATAWQTGTGVEQLMIAFLEMCIAPRAARIEQEIDSKLLVRPRDRGYFSEFVLDGLARGDLKSRMESYQAAWGRWMTADEIRDRENLNPYVAPTDPTDVGKVLLAPLNMADLSDVVGPAGSATDPQQLSLVTPTPGGSNGNGNGHR